MEETVSFTSFDGVRLTGTLRRPESGSSSGIVILIHGVQTTRDEQGFYINMAEALAGAGFASFRADWRCHGDDHERPLSQLTLAGVYNDIDAAVYTARQRDGTQLPIVLMAASFSGGVTVRWSSRNPEQVQTVILLNPVVDYVDEYVTSQGYGSTDGLNAATVKILEKDGEIVSQRKPFTRAMLNEIRAMRVAPHRDIAYWIIHGDIDTGVNIRTSKAFALAYESVQLIIFPGAEHGFSDPGDWEFKSPKTQANHAVVRREVVSLLTTGKSSGDLIHWSEPAA